MKTATPRILALLALVQLCFAPPVTQKSDKDADNVNGLEDYMEYHRYLREVVNALESDAGFREKLEKAEEHDIKSGKIAEELQFVSHHVRNRLDEIKRIELNRLRELTEKKRRLQHNIDLEDPTHKHLDHQNPHTFEIDDLKKLIAKTTADLVEADKRRRDEFKAYELQKEYDKQVKLNHTTGAEREKIEKEFEELEQKHKKHEKLHEPGHKAQLEEVWQEQDQMQQDFDPKTFFMLHDIDSNGLWDQDEVKALFIKELEKMYAEGHPEDDMRERIEEMERMRESVFREVDVNKDGFIDYDEFLAQTKRNDFQQDRGWESLDERKPYTDQELEEYIRVHQQLPQGYGYPVPPGHPNAVPVYPGGVPQPHPGQYQMPQHPQVPPNYQQMPQHPQAPPNYQQVPQQHYQQVPPQQQQNYQQVPPQQQNYQQVPPQQQNYQQVPLQQQQQNHQQVPPQQQNQQQVPAQQQNYQQPPPQQQNIQQHPNNIPQVPQQVPEKSHKTVQQNEV